MTAKRNRKKLKARAAAWRASKEDTYEAAVFKRMFGYNLMTGDPTSKGQPKGILNP